MTLRAVLLDIDGTLIDSNYAHARSWVDVLTKHGFDVEVEQVRRLIGKGGDKLLPELTGLAEDSERGKALSEERAELFVAHYIPHIRPFAQVRPLLERLLALGYTLTVATSASAADAERLIERTGAADLLTLRTSSDDADRSKPDPDIVEAALKKAKAKPDEAILLGDTPYDIEAAQRAGVRTIAVRCGGWDDEALRGAVAIYDDPAQLLAELDRSPLAEQPSSPPIGT